MRAELRSQVSDVLKVTLADEHTLAALLRRANGASPVEILAAALSVAREQQDRIGELESALHDNLTEINRVEEEIGEVISEIETELIAVETTCARFRDRLSTLREGLGL